MIFILIFLEMLASTRTPEKSNFQAQTIDSTITIGYGIALGDVDGDKKPDILLADKTQFVWYRNGDWKKFVMAENLTQSDNVCIAAQDLDGDGKVEVAVGAQWNPGETKDLQKSGSVHFLKRPADPTTSWTPVELYHEVTIHRMRWIKSPNGNSYLVVLPLHGKDNVSGTGKPVNMLVFKYPELLQKESPTHIVSTDMHLTHNFDFARLKDQEKNYLYVVGKEGIGFVDPDFSSNTKLVPMKTSNSEGAGEIRLVGTGTSGIIATIEPMHGNKLVVYTGAEKSRQILDTTLSEGHALGVADILGTGTNQIVAGWRRPDKNGKVGIKIYSKNSASATQWDFQWIDENGMACEDLQVADLNGDGKLDIIASGRATHNLKIYWNIASKR